MLITIFKDFGAVSSPHRVPIETIFDRIVKGKSKPLIEKIRNKKDASEDYDEDKKRLPLVLFSAGKTIEKTTTRDNKSYTTHRLDECVVEHSGIFVIDFDKCDVEQKLEQLKKDPYVYACWTGPSGNGVKALIKCPTSLQNHNLYYTAFLDRYPELDSTSRNISRGTFESYDPNLWVNSGSLVWDKRMTEEQRKKNTEKSQNRRGHKVLSTAVAMVRSSFDGTKHSSLRDAAVLIGGYIATGRVNEEEALKVLEEEIQLKGPKDMEGARSTIRDGINYGKSRPLHESKKIEKAQEFLRREDGTYEFLADNEEMTEYEMAVINGTLEMGLPTGVNLLNEHWMFKKHHLVWIAGMDNTGKSFYVWYISVLAAMLHGWKILIHSAENGDGMVRKKLKEFYLGKSLKVADDEELTFAHDFVEKYFKIISSKQFHTLEDFLLKAEIVHDEGFEFNVVVAEPFNAFDPPTNIDRYSYTIRALNILRVFKENYSSVWVCDHVTTAAARLKDAKGFIQAPWKTDVEMGAMKANKGDDFMIVHRVINDPVRRNDTEIHVNKIKDIETGGFPTDKDDPVILLMNMDKCGYTCNGVDPIKDYWNKHKL